jgi:hypothetical protein
MFSRNPLRQQHGERPHEPDYRLHGLEHQQNAKVEGHHNEQAGDERAAKVFA